MKTKILYEDEAVIVCEKPVGMLVQSNRSLDADMVNELKNHIDTTMKNKKEPYIGLISRLDRPVGGVLVFAKTQAAAKNLSAQVQGDIDNTTAKSKTNRNKMEKQYYAVVDSNLSSEIGNPPKELVNYLVKDAKTNTAKVTSKDDKNGKTAILIYQVLSVSEDKDGNRFEGTFKNDMKDGPFVERDKNGNETNRGVYKNDKIVSEEKVSSTDE